MPIRQLFTAALENSLNRFFRTQALLQPSLNALRGKRLVVFLDVLEGGLTLVFDDKILVVNGPTTFDDAKTDIDAFTCIIKTKVSVLSQLSDKSQLTALIQRGDLELVGDIAIAQQVSELAAINNLDFEQALATYTSDVFAHSAFKVMHGVHSKVRTLVASLANQAADFVLEERPIAARQQGVEGVGRQIEQLRDDIDRVTAKLNKLETIQRDKASSCD